MTTLTDWLRDHPPSPGLLWVGLGLLWAGTVANAVVLIWMIAQVLAQAIAFGACVAR